MSVDWLSPDTIETPRRVAFDRRRPRTQDWLPRKIPPVVVVRTRRWPWTRLSVPARLVVLLALASFGASLLIRAFLYPQGSGDADEAAYVLQARMLLEGRLTLDTRVVEPYFQPWLTGVHGNQVFTKYLPGWPAMLALSQALFHTMVVAPAAVAAVWVLGAYLLTRELFDDQWMALTAAAMVALSPLVLVHTALPLAYAPCAAVLTLASALLLRGIRLGMRRDLVGGGLLVGLALLIRPFDAILVVGPLALFVITWHWQALPTTLARAGWGVVGAAPMVALLLAYCDYVTGSPLRLPQTSSDPLDTFGFGPRRILPTEPGFLYTHRLAATALQETLTAAPSWYFGGVGLMVLALAGLFAPGRRLERLLLFTTTSAVLTGYFFWWGSAFAMPGLRNGLGPHYHLAGFTPVVILAASGARWLWTLLPGAVPRPSRERARQRTSTHRSGAGRLLRPTALTLVTAGLVGLTLPTLPARIDVQRGVNSGNAFLNSLIPAHLPGPAVIVVTPGIPSRYTQVPYHTLRNSPDLDGPVVYAADIGPGIAGLPDRMPGRTIYDLRPDEVVDPTVPGSFHGSFVQLHQVTGTRITIQLTVRPPAPTGTSGGSGGVARGAGATPGGQVYVRLGADVSAQALPTAATGASQATFALDTGVAGGPNHLSARAQPMPGELIVGYTAANGAGWEERFPLLQRPSGDLRLLAPGSGWRQLPGGPAGTQASWVAARIAPTLDVALAGS